MGTTIYGLPYPEPTDPVAAGADAIKALAEAIGPTAWTPITLSSGWANLGAEWATAVYRRVGDRVELRGLIARTPATIGAYPIAQFAVGWRPPKRELLTAQVNQGIARVDMGGVISGSIPSGELRVVTAWAFAGTTADLGLLSLSGLSWSLT